MPVLLPCSPHTHISGSTTAGDLAVCAVRVCLILRSFTPAICPVFSLAAFKIMASKWSRERTSEMLEKKSYSKKLIYSQEPQGQQKRE